MTKRKHEKRPQGGPGEGCPGEGPAKFVLHEHIGGQLKAMFDRVVEEPVPDRFRELLEKLERERSAKDEPQD